MEKLLKYCAVAIFLFIFYLYSGGIYKYHFEHNAVMRVNKITGVFESLNNGNWIDIKDLITNNMIKKFRGVDIFDDREFKALDPEKKRKVILNYFNSKVAGNDFYALSSENQAKVQEAFVRMQLRE